MDFDDTLNIGGSHRLGPSNAGNPNSDSTGAALECITDLEDCCGTESGTVRAMHGNWYFPNGSRVDDFVRDSSTRFMVNRGPNEIIGEQQFNGSVRLFRRYSNVRERGRFRCELPNAADPNINQTIYVNICELILGTHDHQVLYIILAYLNYYSEFCISF